MKYGAEADRKQFDVMRYLGATRAKSIAVRVPEVVGQYSDGDWQ